MHSKSMYIALCGMSVALAVTLMALIGRIPGIDGFASCIPPITITPVLSEYGWKKTVPVIVALAILTFLVLPGTLAAVIVLSSYYVLFPDISGFENWEEKWIIFCSLGATVSAGIIFVVAKSTGFAFMSSMGNLVYLVLLVLFFIIAAMFGKLHIILREKLYMPFLHPIIKRYL